MRRNITKILFGIAAIAGGFALIGAAFDLWELNAVRGWWTLFIIIPAIGGIISEGFRIWNSVVLCLGALLFVEEQEWLTSEQFWLVFGAAALVIIGLFIIFGGRLNKCGQPKGTDIPQNQPPMSSADSSSCPRYSAIFSGNEYKYNGTSFPAGSATAIFGGLDIDLTSLVLERDSVFNATVLFGGIDIFVPPGLNVTANGIAAFGGCDNFAATSAFVPGVPTLHIKYNVVFGGIDIKVR